MIPYGHGMMDCSYRVFKGMTDNSIPSFSFREIVKSATGDYKNHEFTFPMHTNPEEFQDQLKVILNLNEQILEIISDETEKNKKRVKMFQEEIEEQEAIIKDGGQAITNEMIAKYKEILYRYTRINPYQAAFLKLFDEKWESEIYPMIEEKVINEFKDFYDDGRIHQEIILQGLSIPEKDSVEWEINFEDETVDSLVHVYMKCWEFDYTALTG